MDREGAVTFRALETSVLGRTLDDELYTASACDSFAFAVGVGVFATRLTSVSNRFAAPGPLPGSRQSLKRLISCFGFLHSYSPGNFQAEYLKIRFSLFLRGSSGVVISMVPSSVAIVTSLSMMKTPLRTIWVSSLRMNWNTGLPMSSITSSALSEELVSQFVGFPCNLFSFSSILTPLVPVRSLTSAKKCPFLTYIVIGLEPPKAKGFWGLDNKSDEYSAVIPPPNEKAYEDTAALNLGYSNTATGVDVGVGVVGDGVGVGLCCDRPRASFFHSLSCIQQNPVKLAKQTAAKLVHISRPL
jgi:hypothetical protein